MNIEVNLEQHYSAIERMTARIKRLEQCVEHLTEKVNRAEANAAHAKPSEELEARLSSETISGQMTQLTDTAKSAIDEFVSGIEKGITDIRRRFHVTTNGK